MPLDRKSLIAKKNFEKPTKVYVHSHLFNLQYTEMIPDDSSFHRSKYNISRGEATAVLVRK